MTEPESAGPGDSSPEGSGPELDETEIGEHKGSDSSARPRVKKNKTAMCR